MRRVASVLGEAIIRTCFEPPSTFAFVKSTLSAGEPITLSMIFFFSSGDFNENSLAKPFIAASEISSVPLDVSLKISRIFPAAIFPSFDNRKAKAFTVLS